MSLAWGSPTTAFDPEVVGSAAEDSGPLATADVAVPLTRAEAGE